MLSNKEVEQLLIPVVEDVNAYDAVCELLDVLELHGGLLETDPYNVYYKTSIVSQEAYMKLKRVQEMFGGTTCGTPEDNTLSYILNVKY